MPCLILSLFAHGGANELGQNFNWGKYPIKIRGFLYLSDLSTPFK